jgi:hypothetical protein
VSMSHRKHADNDVRSQVRFPQQQYVLHPADYILRAEDQAQVRRGRALFLTGSVLAEIQRLCRFCGSSEHLVYYLAQVQNPCLIDDILIPDQVVSCCSCEVDGQAVLRASREVRAQGKRIVGAGHSHGYGSVFSSNTDHDQMKKLASEAVGYAQDTMIDLRGTVERVSPIEVTSNAESDRHVLRVSFDGLDESVEIETGRHDLGPDDLRVTRKCPCRQIISIFTTSNADGEHYFPGFKVRTCVHCGHKEEQFIEAWDICVHIVGPMEISPDKEEALLDMAESRIRLSRSHRWTGLYASDKRGRDSYGDSRTGDFCRDPAPITAPAPFEIYRRNRLVATVPATVLEEAAAKNSRLATALGWRSDHENPE